MIPLSDRTPSRRFPYTNWALITLNIIVFVYELTLTPAQLQRFFTAWGSIPFNTLSALMHPDQASRYTWATLITAQFMHAGWLHIAGNLLYLWVFGSNVEDVLGHFVYLFFYLVCGIAADLIFSFIAGPLRTPSIGASGAIAGVLGAYILLYPWGRIKILIPMAVVLWAVEVPAFLPLGWWFVQQFFYGALTLNDAASVGVAFWAHIGGFVAGMILILPFIGRAFRRRMADYNGFDQSL
jgi:membrane associated rhomboid family serine protease